MLTPDESRRRITEALGGGSTPSSDQTSHLASMQQRDSAIVQGTLQTASLIGRLANPVAEVDYLAAQSRKVGLKQALMNEARTVGRVIPLVVLTVATDGTGGAATTDVDAVEGVTMALKGAAEGSGGLADAAESRSVNSFTAATPVLLASGAEVPISKIHVGDKVIATDPGSRGRERATTFPGVGREAAGSAPMRCTALQESGARG